jgi:hypothetical protein
MNKQCFLEMAKIISFSAGMNWKLNYGVGGLTLF